MKGSQWLAIYSSGRQEELSSSSKEKVLDRSGEGKVIKWGRDKVGLFEEDEEDIGNGIIRRRRSEDERLV